MAGTLQERYRDATADIGERTEDLLGRMTLDEKLAQLGCVWITALMDHEGFSVDRAREVATHGIGEVTRISGATALRPKESATLVNEVQRYMVEETRLGIPVLVHEEGTGGFLAREATVFPQGIGLASSFDPDLLEEVAAVVRDQMRAVGARHCLAPVLDVARDPRWGRVEETFGEDPVLVGVLGTAYVRGLQTEDLLEGVLATGKHFLGHALPEGGRNHAPVQLGPRELRDVYADPFAAAISGAGLASIMNSYSSVDGLAPAGSRSILTDLLRGELGFEGIVVADYFAVSLLTTHHRVAANKREAAARALTAGLDVELPETNCFGEPLREAIAADEVGLELVDQAVRRVLRLKFALGLFEHHFVDPDAASASFETAEQRSLARRAASESLVLLRNSGLLPLDRGVGRIAVVGPGADDPRLLQGDYHYPAHQEIAYETPADEESSTWNGGSDLTALPRAVGEWKPGPYFTKHITPFEGVRGVVGRETEVLYAPGCAITGSDRSGIDDAARLVAGADVGIVVVGGRSGLTQSSTVGEARDATDLQLTGAQIELVEVCAATGTPIVVVVLSGRVHDLSGIEALPGALVQAWPLGEEGGAALAEMLFGATNPSGRLPVSLPRHTGQVPRYAGHRAGGSTAMFYGEYSDSPTTPLFAFGHGLSYTTFSYSGLSVEATDTTSPIVVSVEVTNTGQRDGVEVVQLYVTDLVASVARPEIQLIGFARVDLGADESRRLSFAIDPSRLAFFNEDMRRVVEPGEFCFAVGASSIDLRARETVRLTGPITEAPLRVVRPTSVSVSEPLAPSR